MKIYKIEKTNYATFIYKKREQKKNTFKLYYDQRYENKEFA